MKLDYELYMFAYTRALQKPAMLSKINGSDASFRRRMWKRIEDKSVMEKLSEEDKKKMYMELLKLQHEC